MKAGRLNRRVTIQQKSVARDALGAEVITWVDVATVWAEVSPYSGREFVALRQAQDEITTRITIRYRPGITPAMRVVQALHWLRDTMGDADEDRKLRRKLRHLLWNEPGSDRLRADLRDGLATLPAWMQDYLKPILSAESEAA